MAAVTRRNPAYASPPEDSLESLLDDDSPGDEEKSSLGSLADESAELEESACELEEDSPREDEDSSDEDDDSSEELDEHSPLSEDSPALLEESDSLLPELSSPLLLELSALELLLLLGTGRGGRGCHTRGERSIPSKGGFAAGGRARGWDHYPRRCRARANRRRAGWRGGGR